MRRLPGTPQTEAAVNKWEADLINRAATSPIGSNKGDVLLGAITQGVLTEDEYRTALGSVGVEDLDAAVAALSKET